MLRSFLAALKAPPPSPLRHFHGGGARHSLKARRRRERAQSAAAAARGLALEERVVRLLRLQGYGRVTRSVRVKDAHGHWSEIDVEAKSLLFGKRQVHQ